VANAWYWIGVAARTALGLGMHRDATNSRMLPVHKRTWMRLWWVLVQFDTIIASSYGKPQVLNLDDSDVPELEPAHFEGIPLAEVDFAIHHSRLCAIISCTMRERWALRASTESKINASKKADNLLAEFMMQMPSSLQAPFSNISVWQATLHLSYNNFVIQLHRPPPNQGSSASAVQDEAAQACADAKVCGDALLTLSSTFDSLLGRGLLPRIWLYANHALFTALIHVANDSASANPIMVAKYHKMFDVLIESLRELAKRWRFAQGLLQLFEERSLKVKEQGRDKNGATSAQSGKGHEGTASATDDVDPANQSQSFPLGVTSTLLGNGMNYNGMATDPFNGGDYMELDSTMQLYGDLLFANTPFLDSHSLDFFLGEINMN
jgi:transcriptional regulatory protein AMDR